MAVVSLTKPSPRVPWRWQKNGSPVQCLVRGKCSIAVSEQDFPRVRLSIRSISIAFIMMPRTRTSEVTQRQSPGTGRYPDGNQTISTQGTDGKNKDGQVRKASLLAPEGIPVGT